MAAAMGKLKAVEGLIALGADLTIEDAAGRSALDAAKRAGQMDAVAALSRAAAK